MIQETHGNMNNINTKTQGAWNFYYQTVKKHKEILRDDWNFSTGYFTTSYSTVLNQFQVFCEKQNLSFVIMSVIAVQVLKYSKKPAEDDSNYLNDLRAT